MKPVKINRIGAEMEEKSVSNEMLANYLGVSVETISRYRRNVIQPSISRFVKIGIYLGVQPGALFATVELELKSPAQRDIEAKERLAKSEKKDQPNPKGKSRK